jgi:hypothetical protein
MKHYTVKVYRVLDVYMQNYLTSVLVGDEWWVSRLGRFNPEVKAPNTRRIESWVGHSVSMDDMEEKKFLTLPGFEFWSLGRPARSQTTLSRLLFPSILQLTTIITWVEVGWGWEVLTINRC